jgi:calcium-dependent protein kinase
VHRDLKLENILFLNKNENSEIKIIDFGVSTILEKKENKIKRLNSKIGTVYYMSPEILKGSYTELCDIWACGVILYIMVFGYPPFNGNNDKEIYESIKKGKIEFPNKISKNLKDLFNHMLCSEKTRFNAKQVLDHIWIKKKAPDSDNEGIKIDLNKLIKFQNYNKLKKAVLCLIASRINSNEVNNLKNIFNALDKDKNGILSKDEIKQCLEKNQIKINFDKVFDSIDTNENGYIDYTEFLAFMLDESFYMNEDKLNEAFKVFDPDDNGLITVENIKKLLNIEDNDTEILNEFIKDNDKDGNGKIDYREFIKMMIDK